MFENSDASKRFAYFVWQSVRLPFDTTMSVNKNKIPPTL